MSGRSQAILTRCHATEGGKDGLSATSWEIEQPVATVGQKATSPFASVLLRHPSGSSVLLEGLALREQEDHPSAFGQPVFEISGGEPTLEFLNLGGREWDWE